MIQFLLCLVKTENDMDRIEKKPIQAHNLKKWFTTQTLDIHLNTKMYFYCAY